MRKYAAIFLAITGVLVLYLAGGVRGEVPGLINYQGKLTDELGIPVNREAEMTFSLYTAAAGNWAIWSESQDVQVTDGIFNVLLGSINPLCSDHFAAGPEAYLGVKIGEDVELVPRQKIASTAYSLRSEISDGFSTEARKTLLDVFYPVGSIYTSTVETNPAVLFGFGDWVAFGAGRVPVGHNGADGDFSSVEKTGGEKTHTLTIPEMPNHRHGITTVSSNLVPMTQYELVSGYNPNNHGVGTSYTGYTGGGGAHNNLQPYIVVYMWKRTE